MCTSSSRIRTAPNCSTHPIDDGVKAEEMDQTFRRRYSSEEYYTSYAYVMIVIVIGGSIVAVPEVNEAPRSMDLITTQLAAELVTIQMVKEVHPTTISHR